MKSMSTIGRSLHVLLLALCGLSFYALLLALLCLIVGLAVSTHVHASSTQSIDAGSNASWVRPGNGGKWIPNFDSIHLMHRPAHCETRGS